jgi:serine/threonine-protein kinase
LVVGRYALYDEIAFGGMGTVHLGRVLGSAGFSRVVAIKRMHRDLSREPELVTMFRDEVRVTSRVRHVNVVGTLDAVVDGHEVLLVMEYVHGEALSTLLDLMNQARIRVPANVATTIAIGVLHGLHAAHEARSETDEPLNIVHRDVSPSNVLVGVDGVPRVVDFGIAKSLGRRQHTRDGQIKGKPSYVAPEVIDGRKADRRADVYSTAVVLWETLTGARLFDGESDGVIMAKVLAGPVSNLRSERPEISETLEAIVLRGLSTDPDKRFSTAREMALALQEEFGVMAPAELGDWVAEVARESLAQRARSLVDVERMPLEAHHPNAPTINDGGRRAPRRSPTPGTLIGIGVPPARAATDDANGSNAAGTPSMRPLSSPIEEAERPPLDESRGNGSVVMKRWKAVVLAAAVVIGTPAILFRTAAPPIAAIRETDDPRASAPNVAGPAMPAAPAVLATNVVPAPTKVAAPTKIPAPAVVAAAAPPRASAVVRTQATASVPRAPRSAEPPRSLIVRTFPSDSPGKTPSKPSSTLTKEIANGF